MGSYSVRATQATNPLARQRGDTPDRHARRFPRQKRRWKTRSKSHLLGLQRLIHAATTLKALETRRV